MFEYAKPEQKQKSKDAVRNKESKKKVATPNVTGIPDASKTRFENQSGFSFDDVRMHYNLGKTTQLRALHTPAYSTTGVVQFEKDEEDIAAEQEANRLLTDSTTEGPLGVMVSTIDTKDIAKPFATSTKHNEAIESYVDDREDINANLAIVAYKLYTILPKLESDPQTATDDEINFYSDFSGLVKPSPIVAEGELTKSKEELLAIRAKFKNEFSQDHVSFNSSLIIGSKKPKLFSLKQPDGESGTRDFGIMLNPSMMLGRILNASSHDAFSNSNLSMLPSHIGIEDKKIRKLGQDMTQADNSEIKSLSFGSNSFMGLLCNTSAFSADASKVRYKELFTAYKHMNSFRLFKYKYDEGEAQKTKLICFGKVTCTRTPDQTIQEDSVAVEEFVEQERIDA